MSLTLILKCLATSIFLLLIATAAPTFAQPAKKGAEQKPADPKEAAEKKGSPIGTWEIKGKDAGDTIWTGTLVLKAGEKDALTGHIDWSASGGAADGAAGKEYVGGTFDAATRILNMKGEKLENEEGISLGTYSAELTEDGTKLVKGKWSDAGDGTWTAKRSEESKPPAAGPAISTEKTGFLTKTFTLDDGTKSKYVLFIPRNYNRAKAVPVILFLHGSGEVKGVGANPAEVGLGPHIARFEKGFPFLTIFPQAEEEGWKPKGVNGKLALGILDKTLKDYRTDPKRVYLTGISMGGIGTWNFALAEPERWAAIVPICGSNNPEKAERIKDIPCWAFHGSADPIIPVAGSRQMVRAMERAGGSPKITVYPGVKHVCWDMAYAEADLWKWLASQKKE